MASTRKILSWCFFPLTIWYAVGVAFRNFGFLLGFKKQTTFHIPTIGVGNLSCGGTGKTPHAEYLLRLLQQHYSVAYLSRGYRRQSKGFVLCEGEPDPRKIGDEAAMIARKFPHVTVAVCEKRADGVKQLMNLPQPPQVIVLDDSYQHRYVKPTCNILLTDYHHPYYTDHILPYGDLREFRNGRARANIVIVTKVPDNLNPMARHNIMSELDTQPCQKIFFSHMEFGIPYRALDQKILTDNAEPAADGSTPPTSGNHQLNLKDADHFLVFTGVANPDSLTQYLKPFGTVTERRFGDHHAFTTQELQQLRQDFDAIPSERKALITTEKDMARLDTPECRDLLQGLPLYVMPVTVKILSNPDFDFDKIILSTVKENISFLDKLSTTHLGF